MNRTYYTLDDMLQQFEDWKLSIVLFTNDKGQKEASIMTYGGYTMTGLPCFSTWWGRGVGNTRFMALRDAIERVGKVREDMVIENVIEVAIILGALGFMWTRTEKFKKKFDGFVDIFSQSHPEFDILKFKREYC